jgi:hypothetical protein
VGSFVAGATHAFEVMVPTDELRVSRGPITHSRNVVWIDAAPPGWMNYVTLILTAAGRVVLGHPSPEDAVGALIDSWTLGNGDTLWLVEHARKIAPAQAAMIHGVRTHLRHAGDYGPANPDAHGPSGHPRLVAHGTNDEAGAGFLLEVAPPDDLLERFGAVIP